MTSGQGGQPPRPEKPEWAKQAGAPFFQVVAEAQMEASRLGHDAVGPTHLILAVLKEADPGLKSTMRSLGMPYQPAHDTALRVLASGIRESDALPSFLSQASAAIRSSASLSSNLGHAESGPEHLLLAALNEADSDLTTLLLEFRWTPRELYDALLSQLP
jgi:ATP-dependent Clp protease ATP-binding subunit ClpC